VNETTDPVEVHGETYIRDGEILRRPVTQKELENAKFSWPWFPPNVKPEDVEVILS
jgi:hypothetical protein